MSRKGEAVFDRVIFIPFAIVIAALTERQSGFVLACLAFVVVLLVIGSIRMWRRLDELERVVSHSTESTSLLKGAVGDLEVTEKDNE